MNISIALRRAIIGVAGLGVVFATTAFADTPSSTNESFSSCSSTLCIDAPPGPKGEDGSGGWGWNSVTNAPVTTLTKGTNATLTVTALQVNPCADGYDHPHVQLTRLYLRHAQRRHQRRLRQPHQS